VRVRLPCPRPPPILQAPRHVWPNIRGALARRGSTGRDLTVELVEDRVVQQFLEAQPEAWKRDHIIIRYDRQVKTYLAGFTAPALEALFRHVATSPVFGSEAERHHYSSGLRWRANHGVTQVSFKPFQALNVPEVLPGQLRLFD
jgi:hypothetical protein